MWQHVLLILALWSHKWNHLLKQIHQQGLTICQHPSLNNLPKHPPRQVLPCLVTPTEQMRYYPRCSRDNCWNHIFVVRRRVCTSTVQLSYHYFTDPSIGSFIINSYHHSSNKHIENAVGESLHKHIYQHNIIQNMKASHHSERSIIL